MMKTVEDVLAKHGVSLEDGYGKFNGVYVRWLRHLGLFQFGADDFGSWANSGRLEINVHTKAGVRQLDRELTQIKDNTDSRGGDNGPSD